MNIENQRSKIGQLPGSIIYTGKDNSNEIKIELITYSQDNYKHEKLESVDDLNLEEDGNKRWIKVIGLNNVEIIKQIGLKLDLDDLILEDVVNTNHTPKVEFHSNFLFLLTKILYLDEEETCVKVEHVSFLLYENLLISFQEYENDVFDYRQRILKESNSVIRKRKSDYLLYSLVDSIVDEYFLVIIGIENIIEELEVDVLEDHNKQHMYGVYQLRKEMSLLKRLVWPVEGTVKAIVREESILNEESIKYFKEIHQNLIQLMDFINMDREVVIGIFDLYLSNNDNKMNKAMQTLTVVATIFTPMTFLTGVYGMNFKYMPELYFKYSYPIFWIIATLNISILYRYYRKKGWI